MTKPHRVASVYLIPMVFAGLALVGPMDTMPSAFGQAPPGSPPSRAGQIQEQRREKATRLQPDTPTRIEQAFQTTEDTVDRLFRGPLRLTVGGSLPQGSGIGAGVAWDQRLGSSDVVFRTAAAGSLRAFYRGVVGVDIFDLERDGVLLTFEGAHGDAPRLDYFGPGPDSEESGRTTFRREDTHADVRFTWMPEQDRFWNTFDAGMLFINVGPGTEDDVATTEAVYTPAEAPGVDIQTDFLRLGYTAVLDFRDAPADPRAGPRVILQYAHFADLDEDSFTFDRVSLNAEHHIPFLNKKRVIWLHANTELSFRDNDQVVPFYLRPTLGGSSDLRGFRRYRFNDENRILFNAEYRWEVNTGLEMALFADAGQVFARPHEITLSDVEAAYGFSFRFKSIRRLVFTVDTGFSHEGAHVWLRFQKLF